MLQWMLRNFYLLTYEQLLLNPRIYNTRSWIDDYCEKLGNANQGFMTCGRVFVLTLSCIMMKNGQTYFKKCLTIFITLHEKVNNHSTFLACKTVFQCTKWVLNRDTCIEQYVAEELNMCVIYCPCTLRKFSCFQTFTC